MSKTAVSSRIHTAITAMAKSDTRPFRVRRLSGVRGTVLCDNVICGNMISANAVPDAANCFDSPVGTDIGELATQLADVLVQCVVRDHGAGRPGRFDQFPAADHHLRGG